MDSNNTNKKNEYGLSIKDKDPLIDILNKSSIEEKDIDEKINDLNNFLIENKINFCINFKQNGNFYDNDKIQEFKKKIPEMKESFKILKGINNKLANNIIDAIIIFLKPEYYNTKRFINEGTLGNILEVIEIASYLLYNKYFGKKLVEFYKSILGSTKINPDNIEIFTNHIFNLIDQQIKKEEIETIISDIFINKESELRKILDIFCNNSTKVLKNQNLFLIMSLKINEILKIYKSFQKDEKRTGYRSYLLTFVLLHEEKSCMEIIKDLNIKNPNEFKKDILVKRVLEMDEITLSSIINTIENDQKII